MSGRSKADKPDAGTTIQPPKSASAASQAAAGTVRAALEGMLAVVREHEHSLGEIDAIAGDGDHGRGMLRGLGAACGVAAGSTDLGVGGTLRTAGAAWADNGAGSSGVLWGALLQAAGTVIGDETAPDAATVVAAIRHGADTVAELGGASVGDKTLLDALVPFVAALDEEVAGGTPLGAAWQRDAKVGRARPLAEKSVGTPDPGAVSFALCATAVGEVLRGGEHG